MCGIFGFAVSSKAELNSVQVSTLISELFRLSEARGSEASGIAIATVDKLRVFKQARPASVMIRSVAYRDYLAESLDAQLNLGNLGVVGHSRLVTNGSQGIEENNQPILSDRSVGVHNGIVVNDGELWKAHPEIQQTSQVDTEVIYRLIDANYSKFEQNLEYSVRRAYKELQGEANIAFLHASENILCLATNVGSIYYLEATDAGLFVFASEEYFLRQIAKSALFSNYTNLKIEQLKPNNGMLISLETISQKKFNLNDENSAFENNFREPAKFRTLMDASPSGRKLIRCTQCILPHTFPLLTFNEKGVCSTCQEEQKPKEDSRATLELLLEKHRSKSGAPDCIVALSGGRDSCYGLHVIKKELRMNPIAYTYDWAMVTDEARRNSARVCGELGVEHIIRSADIMSKRRNIRMNVGAWLKRPDLGMIPLFMAGDKQFFHFAGQVSQQTGVPLVIFCGGNNLEVTRFKTGFCGIKDKSANTMMGLDPMGKLKLLAYYAKNFLLNPSYLNRSLLDTLFAFYTTYLNRQEFLYLYRYVDWDESVIADTLSKHYGWETSVDSASTWRIGDGTAAFYNYIYHTVAGFSEHDTFRSNQIRAGIISRERALELVHQENKPRYAAMQEYARLVGFSLDEALVVINNIPKRI